MDMELSTEDMELSADFTEQITDIRKKYKIPPDGFSYLKEHEIGLGIPKYLDFDIILSHN